MPRKIETLTMDESRLLLDYIGKTGVSVIGKTLSARNYTMVLLMLDAGLRVSEVCKLEIRDLFFNGEPVRALTIRPEICKTKYERIVPLSPRLQDAIRAYKDLLPNAGVLLGTRPFFCGKNYTKHISARQVERIIGSAALASIGRKIHPHVLRHTFATRLSRQIDLKGVQEALGHKRLSSTEIYLHSNAQELKDAIETISNSEPSKSNS